jgi:hypothetical protein
LSVERRTEPLALVCLDEYLAAVGRRALRQSTARHGIRDRAIDAFADAMLDVIKKVNDAQKARITALENRVLELEAQRAARVELVP